MFNGGTLLCLIVAIGAGIYLLWPWIVANLIVDIDATHPDAMSSMDLRQRELDPVDGVPDYETQALIAALNARATRLGYTRFATEGAAQ